MARRFSLKRKRKDSDSIPTCIGKGFAKVRVLGVTFSASRASSVKNRNTTPSQNITPSQNVTPSNNVAPSQNVVPSQDVAPSQNAIISDNIASPCFAGVVRTPSILKRTGSKLLSILRMKRSKSCPPLLDLNLDSLFCLDRQYPCVFELPLDNPASDDSLGLDKSASQFGITIMRASEYPPDCRTGTAAASSNHSTSIVMKGYVPNHHVVLPISNLDGEYESKPPLDAATSTSSDNNRDLRQSKSSPTLSYQLRRGISSVLTPTAQTVVHRPACASRPTILTGDNAQDSYTPSPPFGPFENNTRSQVASLFRSSVPASPLSNTSTAPTSFFSSRDSQVNKTSIRPTTSSSVNPDKPSPGLATICESPIIFLGISTPEMLHPTHVSIATVERAAAAKIFLETYYTNIYSTKDSPRALRRNSLELKLSTAPLSVRERQQERIRFFQSETKHLRLTRALKTKGLKSNRKPSTANYEVTRILGKGSFGVVKLVRDKVNVDPDAMETILDYKQCRQNSRMDLGELKSQVYAMKVIRKSDMLRNSQEGHLRAERDFLVASANSRWVVPLVASFQDRNNLYLVMEYMVGGDFLGLLLREDILPEGAARWYIAQMILCVEEAHRMKWIHRDVKPDNFLISPSGHLKISDFGLAFDGHWSHHQQYYNATRDGLIEKLGVEIRGDAEDVEKEMEKANARNVANAVNGKQYGYVSEPNGAASRPEGNLVIEKLDNLWKRRLAKSVVGTSQYMAPEVIRGDMYDGRCDWWSIGIILYEVSGIPCFSKLSHNLIEIVSLRKNSLLLRNKRRNEKKDS
jgi:serine/threonine protein kinase